MLRRCAVPASSLSVAQATAASQRRWVRYGKVETMERETMPGRGAGQLSLYIECAGNPDHNDERRFPQFAPELAPKPTEQFPNALAREFRWGVDSATMFLNVNESPGRWWNAHETTFISVWDNIGKHAMGYWCGVYSNVYGTEVLNWKQYKLRGRCMAARDENGALHKDYQQTDTKPPTTYMMPHTKEHQHHRRYKNPPLKQQKDITTVEAKRMLREIQYHLANTMRVTLTDGYFGSHPATSTAFRVLSDNVAHAYVNSLAAIRNSNIVDRAEMVLSRRVHRNACDEWAWRRPGVLVYHTPGYQFEKPRIVEEFGGPRPQDLGVSDAREKFAVHDPYSLPMKALLGGEPSVVAVLNTIAFYAGRWGFYADDRELLSLQGDAVLSPDGQRCTLVIHDGTIDTDKLRASPLLYGARHFRLAEGILSRAWDMSTIRAQGAKTRKYDFVEDQEGLIHRPLPQRLGPGGEDAHSHRFTLARQLTAWGFKRRHSYSAFGKDPKAAAAAAGHTFAPPKELFVGGLPRPSAIRMAAVDVIIVAKDGAAAKKTDAADAAKRTVASIAAADWLYAEPEKLEAVFARELGAARSLSVIGEKEAAAVIANLAAKGPAV